MYAYSMSQDNCGSFTASLSENVKSLISCRKEACWLGVLFLYLTFFLVLFLLTTISVAVAIIALWSVLMVEVTILTFSYIGYDTNRRSRTAPSLVGVCKSGRKLVALITLFAGSMLKLPPITFLAL